MRKNIVRPVAFLVLAYATVLFGSQIQAQTLPLTGEAFISDRLNVTDPQFCSNRPGDEGQFKASGVAVGPYPGRFVEFGFFEFALHESHFGSTFEITTDINGDGTLETIVGQKGGIVTVDCSADRVVVTGIVFYRATIGDTVDEGLADIRLIFDRTKATGTFNEFFRSFANSMVILEPAFDENPGGTSHTVTATALVGGQPAPGIRVNFTVTGSQTSASGSCTTDSSGRCSFTYAGPQVPDVNSIFACADLLGVCGTATKVFFLPASTPGEVTGGGHILFAGIIHGLSFGFNAQFTEINGFKGQGAVVDHTTGTKIKILDVTFLAIAGTHATFRGNAEIDGVSTTYIIDVDDLGEPGVLRDTFRIQTETGYAAGGILTGGNIQIHN